MPTNTSSPSHSKIPPEGKFDKDGNLYLPPDSKDPLSDVSTNGTTGKIVPPGTRKHMDDLNI